MKLLLLALTLVCGPVLPGKVLSAVARPGVYWNPELPGMGFAFEFHGDRAFVTAYTYDATGAALWYAGDGHVEDNALVLDLQVFGDGPCLLCGPEAEPAVGQPMPLNATFEFTGPTGIRLMVNDGATVLELERFALRHVQSEGTIAGVTFTMPDLTGRWLFTDTVDGVLHQVVELEAASSGIADSGLAFFRGADGELGVTCMITIEGLLRCELRASGEAGTGDLLLAAEGADISHDRIVAGDALGVRLD